MNKNIERLFDNEYYYSLYPDVKAAVEKKQFKSGYHHWTACGRREGRSHKLKTQVIRNNPVMVESESKYKNHMVLGGYKEPERKHGVVNSVFVPEEFRPIQSVEYPKGNKIPFERYFYESYNEIIPFTHRTYLPVHWCAYYVNNSYGKDIESIEKLQSFLDNLDKTKKYFTIVQYDDGIINNISGLDMVVYSMGCNKPGYYPLPLISQPLNNSMSEVPETKDIEYSFVGANTHPIREKLVKSMKSKDVTFDIVSPEKYNEILKRTKYALCPRGYGVASFRMYESMHYGCVPVYISDKFWEPLNLPFEYGIKITPDKISKIKSILKDVDFEEMQKKVKYYYENYFVYSSCFNSIIKTLQ